MPLTLVAIGEKRYVKQVTGREDTRHFLESLGFVAGSEVSIVSELGGNVIVNIKGTRVAISKSMANKILIGE